MRPVQEIDAVRPAHGERRDRARASSGTPVWLAASALAGSVLFLVFVALQPWVPAEQAFRDMYLATLNAEPHQIPSLLGFASNAGIALWCASASTTLFAWLLVASRAGPEPRAALLLAVGLYSGLMTADDLFMMHEQIYPRLLGLDETALFAIYGVLVAGILVSFRALLWRTCPLLLSAALLMFALSIAGDLAPGLPHDFQRWAEDAPKFAGIVFWTVWCLRLSWLLSLEALLGPAPGTAR